jgi:hypothetical protein
VTKKHTPIQGTSNLPGQMDLLEQLRLSPDQVQAALKEQMRVRVVSPALRKRQQHFIRVPWGWYEQLLKARHAATLQIAMCILYQHWKHRGEPFTLTNAAAPGITRWRKWKALVELEGFGLITIERRNRKSPIIHVR